MVRACTGNDQREGERLEDTKKIGKLNVGKLNTVAILTIL